MLEPSANGNGVRISNQQIYDKLVNVEVDVRSVKQTQSEVITPTLNAHETRMDRLELRLYTLFAGLLTAVILSKGLGLL